MGGLRGLVHYQRAFDVYCLCFIFLMFLFTLQPLAALVKILLIFMVSKSLKYDTEFLNSLMLLIIC